MNSFFNFQNSINSYYVIYYSLFNIIMLYYCLVKIEAKKKLSAMRAFKSWWKLNKSEKRKELIKNYNNLVLKLEFLLKDKKKKKCIASTLHAKLNVALWTLSCIFTPTKIAKQIISNYKINKWITYKHKNETKSWKPNTSSRLWILVIDFSHSLGHFIFKRCCFFW